MGPDTIFTKLRCGQVGVRLVTLVFPPLYRYIYLIGRGVYICLGRNTYGLINNFTITAFSWNELISWLQLQYTMNVLI